MNKKKLGKVTGVATASFLIAGTTAFTAFAAMPSGTAVIGTKAYDLNYVNDPANQEEITAAMVAADFKVYVKDFAGNWIVNETEAPLTDLSVIPAVEYKAADGTATKYDAKDGNVTATTADLKVASVSAINNTKIMVTLAENAPSTVAATDFAITKNSDSSVLAVSSIIKVDGKNVYLRTAAQAAGQLYTVKANATTATFAGRPVDAAVPTVASARATSNTAVKVVFNEAVDADTALVAANYAISGLTVSGVAMDTTDTTGSTVVLTTSAQTLGTAYTVIVSNVTDLAENKIGATLNSAVFAGKAADTTAPALAGSYSAGSPETTLKSGEAAAVRSKNNLAVEVIFNEKVDAASAETVSNYTIPGLTVQSATVYHDTDLTDGTDVYDGRKVILTTTAQTLGTAYTLTIAGVKDIAGNAIAATPATTATFAGKAADTTAPSSVSATARTNTTVRLTFNEELDKASAETVGNYTIPGLTVSAATLVTVNGEAKYVDLTTAAQTLGAAYTVTVVGVKDTASNAVAVTPALTASFAGRSVDTTAPTISSATSAYNATTGASTVTVVFDEAVDKATAENIVNYTFDSNLGYPTKAQLDANDATGKTVILTTNAQTAGTVYKLSVLGVKDLAGNAITTAATYNVNGAGSLDATAPTVVSVVPVDVNTVDVTFSEALASGGLTTGNYSIDNTFGSPDAAWFTDTTNKVVRLQYASKSLNDATVYSLTYSGQADIAGNTASSTTKTFGGTTVANSAPKLSSVTPIDSNNIVLNFSEPIVDASNIANDTAFTLTATDFVVTASGHTTRTGSAVQYYNGDKSKVLVTLGGALDADTVYTVTMSNLTNYEDLAALNAVAPTVNGGTTAYVTFGSSNVANVGPKLQSVVPVDNNTIKLTFDKNIALDADNDGSVNEASGDIDAFLTDLVVSGGTIVSGDDSAVVVKDNTITVYFANHTFNDSTVYTINIADFATDIEGIDGAAAVVTGSATTTQTNTFGGTSVANAAPTLSSVEIISANKVRVTFSEPVASAANTFLADGNKGEFVIKGGVFGTTGVAPTALAPVGTSGTTYDLTLANKLYNGVTYTLVVGTPANIKDIAGIGTLKTDDSQTYTSKTIAGVTAYDLSVTAANNTTAKVDIASAGISANTNVKIFAAADYATNGLAANNLGNATPGNAVITLGALTSGTVTIETNGVFSTVPAGDYVVVVNNAGAISNVVLVTVDSSHNIQVK